MHAVQSVEKTGRSAARPQGKVRDQGTKPLYEQWKLVLRYEILRAETSTGRNKEIRKFMCQKWNKGSLQDRILPR
jgi:hypothetical protein